jgi:hypothetical protein
MVPIFFQPNPVADILTIRIREKFHNGPLPVIWMSRILFSLSAFSLPLYQEQIHVPSERTHHKQSSMNYPGNTSASSNKSETQYSLVLVASALLAPDSLHLKHVRFRNHRSRGLGFATRRARLQKMGNRFFHPCARGVLQLGRQLGDRR